MRFTFIYLIFFMTAIGCGSSKSATSDVALINTRWEVELVNGKKVAPANNAAYFLLKADAEHTMVGHTSCNGLSGNYTLSGNKLTFSGIITTMRGCMGDFIEKEFLNILSRTTGYRIVENKLVLLESDEEIAVMKSVEVK